MLTRTLALLAAFALAPAARADDATDAKAKLKEFLADIKDTDVSVATPLADGAPATFPDFTLYSYVFPRYPVARAAPAPLKSNNVIAVPKKKDAKVILNTDSKELEKFFKENARAVKKNEEIEEAVRAWLRASAELNQDGFFKFTVKAGKVGTDTADGIVEVDPKNGDKGDIKATVTFKDGKFASAETKVNLSAGIRPRCQATKLLDPDPIVRAMAEDSIRVMGSAAKPYLDEQRAKASPELKKAIDRIWAQILAEGR